MRRLIYLVLAAALTCGTVYLYFKSAVASSRSAATQGKSAPRAKLDQANRDAKDIEQSTQVRIDDLAKKTE